MVPVGGGEETPFLYETPETWMLRTGEMPALGMTGEGSPCLTVTPVAPEGPAAVVAVVVAVARLLLLFPTTSSLLLKAVTTVGRPCWNDCGIWDGRGRGEGAGGERGEGEVSGFCSCI